MVDYPHHHYSYGEDRGAGLESLTGKPCREDEIDTTRLLLDRYRARSSSFSSLSSEAETPQPLPSSSPSPCPIPSPPMPFLPPAYLIQPLSSSLSYDGKHREDYERSFHHSPYQYAPAAPVAPAGRALRPQYWDTVLL